MQTIRKFHFLNRIVPTALLSVALLGCLGLASASLAGYGGGISHTVSAPQDVGLQLEALSQRAQSAIAACADGARGCVADALDNYAAALQEMAPLLPPQLQNLPGIVATAAGKVRVSKTRREAVQAVRSAIEAVHKDIALLKADDPIERAAGTREGELVAATFEVARIKLEKAIGL